MVSVNGLNHEQALISVRNLDKKYMRGGQEIHVLQGLNLDVGEGEFIAFRAQRFGQNNAAESSGRS